MCFENGFKDVHKNRAMELQDYEETWKEEAEF